MSPEEDRTHDTVDSEPKHYQLSCSGSLLLLLSSAVVASVFCCCCFCLLLSVFDLYVGPVELSWSCVGLATVVTSVFLSLSLIHNWGLWSSVGSVLGWLLLLRLSSSLCLRFIIGACGAQLVVCWAGYCCYFCLPLSVFDS